MKQNMENIYNEAESEKHSLQSVLNNLKAELESAVRFHKIKFILENKKS